MVDSGCGKERVVEENVDNCYNRKGGNCYQLVSSHIYLFVFFLKNLILLSKA